MMYGRGLFDNNRCFGYGNIGNGWNILILIGSILIIAAVVIYFVRKRNKNISNNAALEILKMKYVQGNITEGEYIKQKKVLNIK